MKAGFYIKLILYIAPNCPRRIVAPNCPRRTSHWNPFSQNSKPTYSQKPTISDHRETLISSCLNFIIFADDTNVFLSHRSITKLFEIMNYELLKVAVGSMSISWY